MSLVIKIAFFSPIFGIRVSSFIPLPKSEIVEFTLMSEKSPLLKLLRASATNGERFSSK